MERAHDWTQYRRTLDVSIDEDIHFSDMLLSERTLKGLEAAGFKKPSPIQRKAIPIGRCGFDLIVQAKSGTGKTCVFAVIALEMLIPTLEKLQVVVLAPTREISVQITNVISSISSGINKVKVEGFIGGLPVEQDKKKIVKCQIAVGAPGRMKHLISSGLMDVEAVRLLVFDEADRLMEENFRKDISYIFSKLPLNKQMIAASATFPEELEKFVAEFMRKPIKVSPGEDTILIGVRQFVALIPPHPVVLVQMRNKTAALIRILSSISFKQCLIFSNYQSWAETMCDELTKEGWPAIYINSSQTQAKRLKAFNTLKEYRCRVLLSTDLTSRGIDAENVNLIINLDLPYDGATYLHRIGRAGRYGTYGIAITIIQEGEEVERFRKLLYEVGGENFHVSLFPKEKITFDIWEAGDDQFQKLSSLFGEYKFAKKQETYKIGATEVKKVDEAIVKEKEAISAVHECRLCPPKMPITETWDNLWNEFLNLKPNDNEISVYENERSYVSSVPISIESSLICLENSGWKSFQREFELWKKKVTEENDFQPTNETSSEQKVCLETTEKKAEVSVEGNPKVNPEVSTEVSAEDSAEDSREDSGEDSAEDSGEDSAEDSGEDSAGDSAEDSPEVDSDIDDIEDSEADSEDNLTDIETSLNEESSETESEEFEVVHNYNDTLQNWYALWMKQSNIITNYVLYCHYWENMFNVS